MTWRTFHHRGEVLDAVVATAERRRDGMLPMDVPGVAENFDGELDLLGALMLKWHARLSGNVERALTAEPLDLAGAVAEAWRRTGEDMPGVRMVLDRATDHPGNAEIAAATSRAREREWIRLAAAAGLANDESAAAAAAGRRVELAARRPAPGAAIGHRAGPDREPPAQSRCGRPATMSFVDRIRAALAA